MASGHQYKRLDSLRGLAALSVGVGHAFLCVYFSQASAWQTAALGIFNGDYAVDLFFVLSGFVLINMVRGFSGAHYAAYLGRRLLRLYPPLWATLIVAYVGQILVAAHAPPCGHLSIWICRLIAQPGSMLGLAETAIPVHDTLNPVTWTVKVEIQASIVYPLVLMIWTRSGSAGKLALAAATVSMCLLFDYGYGLPHYLFLFVAGVALNDIRALSARHANRAAAMGLLLMGVSGFFAKGHSAAADIIAGTSATLLIASVAYRCPKYLAAVLDNRTVLRLGQISYPYYLLNPIVLWLIARTDARWLSPLVATPNDPSAVLIGSLLAACAALATVLAAEATNRIVEAPSIALSRRAERRILGLLEKSLRKSSAPRPLSSAAD